jgi:dihydrofolate synthase / folylpolyglutamate synthase
MASVLNIADREFFGMKLGLENTKAILKRLKNPEKQFSSIHIAGTNGKGSTAAMLASILKEAGYKVGLFTSPHLVDVRERFQINGEMISEAGLEKLSDEIRHCEQSEAIPLTFFEFVTALAFLYFARSKVDIAVIETGMGGRLDATNVITPEVSVITNVAMDHAQHLGDTLEKIAFEKAGIIKKGVPVVCGEEFVLYLPPFLPLSPALSPKGERVLKVGLLGEHQQENASLALQAIQCLNKSGKWKISDEAIQSGLENVKFPGRLEYIKPNILLDGAHNPAAMRTLREYLEENHAEDKIQLIIGMMEDKAVDDILKEILPVADKVIVTAPKSKRALSPAALEEKVQSYFARHGELGRQRRSGVAISQKMPRDCVALARNDASGALYVVTGSLFLVGDFSSQFFYSPSL